MAMLFYVVPSYSSHIVPHRPPHLFDRKRSWPSPPSLLQQLWCDSPTVSFLHHIILSTRHSFSFFSTILAIIFASGQRHAIEIACGFINWWNRIQILLLLDLSIVIIDEERSIFENVLRISPERDFVFPSERSVWEFHVSNIYVLIYIHEIIYLFYIYVEEDACLKRISQLLSRGVESSEEEALRKGRMIEGGFGGSSVDGPSNKTRRDGLSAWLTRRYSWLYYRFLKISLHSWSCATSISTLRIRVAHATWPSRGMRRRASTHVYVCVCVYMWHVRASKYCMKKGRPDISACADCPEAENALLLSSLC